MRYRLLFIGMVTFVLAMMASAIMPIGSSGFAFAQTVSNIVVEGNQRVETETILSYTQISRGDPVSEEAMDDAVKALFQTGLFADVDINARGSTIVIKVEENPLINRVNFEGNSEIKDDNLLKEVELRERMIFTRAKVQNNIQRIVALYRRSGHFSARVEPKIIRLPQNRVDLVFEINEGDATRIEKSASSAMTLSAMLSCAGPSPLPKRAGGSSLPQPIITIPIGWSSTRSFCGDIT